MFSRVYNKFKSVLQENLPKIYGLLDRRKAIIKYFISGVTAASVNLFLLYFLTDFIGMHYLASSSLAFVAAFFVSFYLQKFWTFRDKDRSQVYQQMVKYLLVGGINLMINGALMYLLVDVLSVWYIFAQIISGLVIAFESFLVYKLLIFKNYKKSALNYKKILITTGIYPPDIGGPATYIKSLREKLINFGYDIKILTYSDLKEIKDSDGIFYISRRQNILSRYFFYFLKAWSLSREADIIYAHDLVSVGLPSALVKVFNPVKKLIVRLGGDFLWEKAFNNGWTKKPLSEYYSDKKNWQEKIFIIIFNFVLKKCDKIIFSTEWQKEIYIKHYGVKNDKTVVIENSFPENFSFLIGEKSDIKNNNLLYAGRLIKIKNLDRLINAIKEIKDINLTIVGEGPEKNNLQSLIKKLDLDARIEFKEKMNREELAQEMNKSLAVIVPSITEISPNTVLECISLAKPVLATREGGFYQKYKDQVLFINPLDQNDIKEKILYLLNKDNYQKYIEDLKLIDCRRSVDDIAREHDLVFNKLRN